MSQSRRIFGLALYGLAAAAAAVDEPARKTVEAYRTSEPPVLDGVLDDPVWQHAPVIEDLHIVVSDEGAKPAQRSRVQVAFDDEALYFAARFEENDPSDVVAKLLRKTDVSFGEDGFTVTLDPLDRGRSGYMFDVNPNGMRSEGLFTDIDRQNWEWEGIWDAAARRDSGGWTAETAIPFKSLSFDPARDAWGFNITRWHGRDSEQHGWVSFNRTQDLARTGLLTGLAGLRQGRGLDVVPGIRFVQADDDLAGRDETRVEPSLDVFWKPTPALTSALTLNPDFAGTAADARQVNQTRFDLFFPEQRAFFLQDVDVFEFGRLKEESGLPFFSRRMGLDDDGRPLTLDAGLKLTGRAGPWSYGLLGVRQDSASGPGSEELFVARAVAHVLEESALGAIATSGSPDGLGNTLAGVDFRYLNTRLGGGRQFEATTWYQRSETDGLDGDDAAYALRLAMPNNEGWKGEAGYKVLERNYFPALGFANRTDVRVSDAELKYTWRPEGVWLRSLKSGFKWELVDQIDGAERSQELEVKLMEAENQSADVLEIEQYFFEERLAAPFEISEGVVIPAGNYRYQQACADLATGEQRAVAWETTVCGGEFYDGDIVSVAADLTWRPSMHWRIGLGGEYNDIHLPGGDFVTRLLRLSVDVAFNVAWSWENFLQYDNVSDTVGVNSILRYIPRAGREAVLAVNSQYEDFDGDRRFRSYASDLTLKLAYTFRF
ncbi:MAG TPA: DUF5916 domain-containing protein [Steroidobacteraceae bacterium]|nr:DUF5916 domain-containing protein [Steroidobacteraceae bacterium]